MANKSNIRSMRFSDDIIELIDRQIGNTFTEKFENLVTRCNWELPAQEKQLTKIQDQIDRKKKELRQLQQAKQELDQCQRQIETIKKFIGYAEITAKQISLSVITAEKCNTD